MPRTLKEVVIKKPHLKCDFCPTEGWELDHGTIFNEKTGSNEALNRCAVCGKYTCIHHNLEACEDGVLCPRHSEIYEFDEDGDGVGVAKRSDGTLVKAPYL